MVEVYGKVYSPSYKLQSSTLVVLDLMLPDRDGWDVTRIMRGDARLAQQVDARDSQVAQGGQAFNEMTAALKEAETLRQNMVADVAHELRTSISVLQGNLWAILNDAYPLEKAELARLYDEIRL